MRVRFPRRPPLRLKAPALAPDAARVSNSPKGDRAVRGWAAPLLPRLVRAVLVTALVTFVVGIFTRTSDEFSFLYDVVAYKGLYLAGVVLCWCSPAAARADRRAWRWVSVSLVLTMVGDLYYTLVLNTLDEPPYPSLADVFYLAAYVPLGISVLTLTRARVPRLRTSTWLDGVVAGLGTAGLLLAVGLRTLVDLSGGDLSVVVVNLAYPLADVALVVVLLAAAAVTGLRLDGQVTVLSAGLLVYLGADLNYLVRTAGGTYAVGGWSDLAWLVAVAVMGLGAGAGSRRPAGRVAPAGDDGDARIGWRVLALPTLAHLSSLVLLVVGWGDTLPLAAGVCAGACLAMALVRTIVTFHEIRDLPAVRGQALTDELTGLSNRRALFERCDRTFQGPRPAPVSLLLLDLDGFKEVNDSLGHQAGDDLLVRVSRRLERTVAPDQVLARLGGTSSPSCCRGPVPRRPSPWRTPWSARWTRRSSSTGCGCTSAAASGWPARRSRPRPARSCCGALTWRCTRRRGRGPAWSSSTGSRARPPGTGCAPPRSCTRPSPATS